VCLPGLCAKEVTLLLAMVCDLFTWFIHGADFCLGTGGESIYGEKFADEEFVAKHDRPFLLSMVRTEFTKKS
jgi:hypothetical protein